jgi:hypothetical protein
VDLLRKDFTVDEAEREALSNGAYDATEDLHRLMTSQALSSPKTMILLGTYNFPPVCCIKQLLIDKIFDLIITKYLKDTDI